MPSYEFIELLTLATLSAFIRPVIPTSLPSFILHLSGFYLLRRWVGVHLSQSAHTLVTQIIEVIEYLALATSHCNVDESAGINHSLASTTLW